MSTGRHIGTLIAVILKARNLPNKRHIGKQDPYCQVVFNGEKRRTKAIKRGGQHPEWDEEIRFELFEDVDELPLVPGQDTPPPPPPKSNGKGPPRVRGGKFMAIACYAEDPREPDLIGEAKVDLTEVLTKGETDEWFTILYKDKYCGEVYLELTFWLDEPPPTKKVTPKPTNGQYGGRGTFVPLGDSASSSLTDLSRIGSVSSRDEIRRENLPPSLRSSNSRLDIYVAPYESIRSHNSSVDVDGFVNEFAELRMDQGGNRRQSMPTGSYIPPRPTSAVGARVDHSTYPGGHGHHQSTYSDGGYPYEYGSGNSYHHDSAPLPDPYQPAYEQPTSQSTLPAPSGFTGHRPRYSMPPASSGFMPLPQSSGFVPLASNLPQQSTGFLPAPTPAPSAYSGQLVPSRIPSSSFSTLPPIASSGFVQGPPPSSSYLPLSQSPSQYYSPSNQIQNAQLPAPYPQHPPPPSSSFHTVTPTSSFPSHSLSSSYSQQLPPPASAPPVSQQPYSLAPSAPPLQHHAHSAPVEQSSYNGHHTPSPSHDSIPPPPPLSDSPSGHYTGSRPLPQPQPQQSQPSYAPPRPRRQSSLPVPPGPPPQGYYNGTTPSFPNSIPYQSIPPPPPLPQAQAQQPPPPPQLSFSSGQLALPGPPPPLPTQSMLQEPSHPPPKRRPSLPPPPGGYQLQQSAFQSLPPPPPPPSLPSHLQYEPSFDGYIGNFPGNGQSYYPGPPPRPPHYPPVQQQQTGYAYSPPIPQDNYGQ